MHWVCQAPGAPGPWCMPQACVGRRPALTDPVLKKKKGNDNIHRLRVERRGIKEGRKQKTKNIYIYIKGKERQDIAKPC